MTPEQIQALRLKYNAAYDAHKYLAMAIADAAMDGKRPSDDLQDREKQAAFDLTKAREELGAALAALVSGASKGEA